MALKVAKFDFAIMKFCMEIRVAQCVPERGPVSPVRA